MRRFPYYRSTTVAALRTRYELRPTFDAPHWSVLLDDIGNPVTAIFPCRVRIYPGE